MLDVEPDGKQVREKKFSRSDFRGLLWKGAAGSFGKNDVEEGRGEIGRNAFPRRRGV